MAGRNQVERANGAEPVNGQGGDVSTIEQVRELLFGLEKRTTEQRLQDLDQKIDALHAELMAQVSMLETRLAETERSLDHQHIQGLEGIGAALSDLGDKVRKIANAKSR